MGSIDTLGNHSGARPPFNIQYKVTLSRWILEVAVAFCGVGAFPHSGHEGSNNGQIVVAVRYSKV